MIDIVMKKNETKTGVEKRKLENEYLLFPQERSNALNLELDTSCKAHMLFLYYSISSSRIWIMILHGENQ
jgi:hypothetical protein